MDILITTTFFQPLQSLVTLYPGVLWLEREVWDMFGVYFQQNPDLRRILTDYGFLGFPLRKDFPLSGFLEVSYDDRKKSIIYKKNSFAQEFRNFYKISSWR
jgi:NADH:ubiquinone oxidoreductase subunit C